MRFCRLLAVHLQQIRLWKLLLISSMVALLKSGASIGFRGDNETVSYLMLLSDNTGIKNFTIFMLPTLLYSMSYILEWESHAVPYWILRTGEVPYMISKMLVCAAAGFLSVFIGYLLYAGILACSIPLFLHITGDSAYELLMSEGKPLLGILGYITDVSMSGAVIAVLGMAASAYIANPFIAVSAPIALYMTLNRLAYEWEANWLSSVLSMIENVQVLKTASETLMRKFAFMAVMLLLLILITIPKMKRRVRNA